VDGARAILDERQRIQLLPMTRATVNLTSAQLLLIRSAVANDEPGVFVTPEQRRFIREVCTQASVECDREKFLIAFKFAVVEAANELEVPYGSHRDSMIDRLISVFIGELYDEAGDTVHTPSRGGVKSTSRLEIRSDISSARF
jgi:hypothetical protein